MMSGNAMLLARPEDSLNECSGEGMEYDTLGGRLRAVRTELYGLDGVDDLAEALDVAPQVWRNVEMIGGVITSELLRAFMGSLLGTDKIVR